MCTSNINTDTSNLSKIAIKWQLIQNHPNDSCEAKFTFINRGKSLLNNKNWALYFNQNTLYMAKMPEPNIGKVEHVNGDLYRFIPGKDFELKPGDSIYMKYFYHGFLINNGGLPCGAYLVENHESDKEKVIMPESFVSLPLTDLKSIFHNPDILSTVPNAENTYAKNLNITSLSKEESGKIIPSPMKLTQIKGTIQIKNSYEIYHQKGLENEAQILAESIKKLFNIKLNIKEGKSESPEAINMAISSLNIGGISKEAYQLIVRQNQSVQIVGNDAAGVFYGVQSLVSLMWADKQKEGLFVECVEIEDAPRFPYRGFLLDVSRNFQQKKDVLRLIELLSFYKINKLNIRITEDEGWRIEINGLPELTKVASKRGHTRDSKNWLTPSFGSGPIPDSKDNFGNGFYSREDFKEILKFANSRHVEIIPEVCFPSHARAAIKAMEARYDFYMSKNDPVKANEYRLVDPNDKSEYFSAQMYKDNIVNVALPSTYHFYETVIKDFKAMYEEAGLKMKVFNTGGDEVPNGAWAKSPLCIDLMKKMPHIKDARQLQGYFLEKAMSIFEKYQLQVTGWEEIVLNKDAKNNVTVNEKFLGKNVVPLVWDNTGNNIDLGYRIAAAGYPVVLCNVTNLYFDLSYNTDPTEPGLYWGGFQDAIDAYVIAPYDVYKTANYDLFGRFKETEDGHKGKLQLQKSNYKNIVGLQAQLWSETLKGAGMMEYYTVPKIFAFAEKSWAQAPAWESEVDIAMRNKAILSGWNVLSNRIGNFEYSKIDAWFGDYNYRIAPPGAIMENGNLKANSAFPGLTVRYTQDGTEPSIQSAIYSSPVNVKGNIKVRAFNSKGRASRSYDVR
jgi:hexosaminidase